MTEIDKIWAFQGAGVIKFGFGASEEVGYEAARLGGSKTLLVTDEGIIKAGISSSIEDYLVHAGLEVVLWSEVEAEPSIENFKNCYHFAQDKGSDIVVGLGGGSSIDVSKVTSMLLKHGGEIMDYIAPPTGEGMEFPGPGLPNIAIPTTSGTGSEVSPSGILSLPDKGIKVGISSNYQRPNVAILDPLLTTTMPSKVTAATGMDALTHAIEAFVARKFDCKPAPKNPDKRSPYGGRTQVTDIFAIKAIELINIYLRRAVNNGYDLEARRGMSLGSLLAGLAFTNAGVGAVHALAYPLGSMFHTPHGVTNALLLPYVMQYNLKGDPARFATIAELMGGNTQGLSTLEAAEKSTIVTKTLGEDVGIPTSLKEVGCKREHIPQLAKDTMKIQRLLVSNPREVTEEDLEGILGNAFEGELK